MNNDQAWGLKVRNPWSIINNFEAWFAFEQRRNEFKSELDFATDLFAYRLGVGLFPYSMFERRK